MKGVLCTAWCYSSPHEAWRSPPRLSWQLHESHCSQTAVLGIWTEYAPSAACRLVLQPQSAAGEAVPADTVSLHSKESSPGQLPGVMLPRRNRLEKTCSNEVIDRCPF